MRCRGGPAALVTLAAALWVAHPRVARGEDGAARTAPPDKIFVQVYADPDLSEAARRTIEDGIADGVRDAVQGTEVVHGHAKLKPLPGASSAGKALARSDKALAEAKKRVRNLEEGALDMLDWAADEYARYLPELMARDGNAGRLISVYSQTAIATFINGELEATRKALRRALVLSPKLEYDPKVFPPQLEELILQEGLLFDELGRGALEISAHGHTDATVFVNGLDRGKAPVTVDDLPPGPNIVTLVAEGAEPVLLPAVVEGGKTHKVEGTIEVVASAVTGPLAGTRSEVGGDRPGSKLREAARELGVGGMVLVTPSTRDGTLELVVHVYDMRGATRVGRGEGTVDPANPAPEAESLMRELAPTVRWKPSSGLDGGDPVWRRAYRHKYFWPAVGATAGLVVLTVAITAATGGLSPAKKVSIFPVFRF